MIFRTEIQPKLAKNTINYNSNLLLIGSCFTQHIGDKLDYYKFNNSVNPFGILFHPKAIKNLIISSLNNRVYTKNDLFFYNERWHCFDTHSDLSATDKDTILTALNNAVIQTKNKIEKATHIIITLGTAWVYNFLETKKSVANCHKVPQKQFSKEILSIDNIALSLTQITNAIARVNSNASVIFTVSPVRHLKDGFIQNQQSKAHLITAIHQVINPENYFPAYEIMMDDLRDYRFYKNDMVHPNEIAIAYIWQKFVTTWLDNSTKETMEQVSQIQKGLAHKPFNPNSEKHQQFLKNLSKKIKVLEKTNQIKF